MSPGVELAQRMASRGAFAGILALCSPFAAAAERSPNGTAVACFFLIIAITLGITYWAARRTRTASDFYVAGARISGNKNGLAIAGDFMSAATLLGMTGLLYTSGFDTSIYAMTPIGAFFIMVFVMTERLRAMGKYTFSDVICARLDPRPMRVLAACTTLVSAVMYLVVQMVGAGGLIQVLFGLEYSYAVVLVGVLMVLYVAFGGMLATTWVQITKAVLLLSGVLVLAVLVLSRFGFDLNALFESAISLHRKGTLLTGPGGFDLDFLSALSLTCALMFGLCGSPHILMRFFTVPDGAAARRSAFVAMVLTAVVFLLIVFVIGPGTVALVTGDNRFLDAQGHIIGGHNMVAMHLSEAVGGPVFLGIMSAIAFATILAVVAGLTLASASAVSHDLYANVLRHGRSTEAEEVRASRFASLLIGLVAVILGIAFEGHNILYLVSLALSVAASTNFPLLILAMYWPGLSTRGALIGGTVGLISAVLLVILGPAVWVQVFGFDQAVFPSAYPAIYSMVAAFSLIFLVSWLDRSPQSRRDRQKFEDRIAPS